MGFSLLEIFPLLSLIFILVLGVAVLHRSPNSVLNRLFFSISLVFGVWMFGTFMMFISEGMDSIVFWDRFIYLGVVFMPALQYHFSLEITSRNKTRITLLIIAYALSFVFLFLSRTDCFISGIFEYRWGVHSVAHICHHFFMIFFFFYIFLLLANFFKAYRTAENIKRKQIVVFAVSFAILNLVGGLGYLPAYKISIYSPISLLAPLIFSILVAYSIVKHQLLDIKFVLRKSSVYFSSLVTIILFVIALRYFSFLFLTDLSAWADSLILMIAFMIYPFITKYYNQIANKYFFSSLYDSKEVIAKLNDGLRMTLDVDDIFKHIFEVSRDAFHFRAFGILRYKEQEQYFSIGYNNGFKINPRTKFAVNEELSGEYFLRDESLVIRNFDDSKYSKKTKKLIEVCRSFEVEVIVPFLVKEKNIGLMILGPKESGEIYDANDLQMIRIIASQSSISIENALLYKETLSFNHKLKDEIAKATKELRSANRKLMKLDEAKSEFISIASHQLRTPLTVIKGYISMMLEGSFGKLEAAGIDSLKKVYESNERLINLVENLLNISRIESGRLQFVYNPVALDFITESVIEELVENAKQKGLAIIYKKPEQSLPQFMIDAEKIRQAVMNLIDNAIKYTSAGNIEVTVGCDNKNVRFEVSDGGIGISDFDLKNLFKKFSRGAKTSLIHTEGTGLGLYVARQMIEAHGGRIWAESRGEGLGSKFCFELPIDNKEFLENNE